MRTIRNHIRDTHNTHKNTPHSTKAMTLHIADVASILDVQSEDLPRNPLKEVVRSRVAEYLGRQTHPNAAADSNQSNILLIKAQGYFNAARDVISLIGSTFTNAFRSESRLHLFM